jgi:hypothetical protein
MGWLFPYGATRRSLIAERIKDWDRTTDTAVLVTTTCIAHCYRGGVFSGVLWSVWERRFSKDNADTEPTQRWIQCDLLQYQQNYGWGYKDMEESMHPYFYSCPLGYLKLVPIEQFGGSEAWREGVRAYHARQAEKRQARRAARTLRTAETA